MSTRRKLSLAGDIFFLFAALGFTVANAVEGRWVLFGAWLLLLLALVIARTVDFIVDLVDPKGRR